jgi:hypothetical protein
MARRIKLAKPSEEMRYKCSLLGDELSCWPDVSVRPMFGMRAFYRKATIFAMLPDKRAFGNPAGIGYKSGGKWKSFEVGEAGEALAVLERAYRVAGG